MTQRRKGRRSAPSTQSGSNGEQPPLKFTRPVMSRDEVLARGQQAADALNEPVFALAVNSIVEDLGTQIMGTEPHETHRREWLYQQSHALGRICQKMIEFVNAAQQLNLEELSQERLRQQDRRERAGFNVAPPVEN